MLASLEQKPVRLITFAVSHYCEKARWGLERLGIPFMEERHVPGFHWLITRPNRGKSVPLLISKDGTFTDSTDILHHLDAIAPANKRLYPAEPKLRRQVEKMEYLFDTQLGVSVRCWAYFYLFNSRILMRKLWCEGVPAVESALFPVVFPFMRLRAQKGYNITAESAASSLDKIKRIFEQVNDLLADGRSYLLGNCFSSADLTFACLAAPILLPPEYGGKFVYLEQLLDEMALVHEQLRKTPAAAYVYRLFREER